MSDPVADLKHELLAAAERQTSQSVVVDSRRPLRGSRARPHLLLAAAAVAATAAVVLFFFAPSGTAPSVIERAQAALTPPRGTIAHRKWVVTMRSPGFGCTVTRRPNELWFDVRLPRRYRLVTTHPFPDPRTFDYQEYLRNLDLRELACARGRTLEIGGSLEPGAEETLVFVRPNRLIFMPWFSQLRFPVDPAADFRRAIREGRAHDQGRTKLHGRTVVRIRIDPPRPTECRDCLRVPAYVFVDPETFYPVEEHHPGGMLVTDRRRVPVNLVTRYSIFEYLPRTAANLALTNIEAQHPGWTR